MRLHTSKKGMTIIDVLVALAVGLILLGIGIYLIQRYVYEQPTTILTDVLSCSSIGNLVGQGQCLRDSHCEGRSGWEFGIKTTTFCSEAQPFCCILPPNKRAEYFTPGSLIISYDGDDYKLMSDDSQPDREFISDDEDYLRAKDRVPVPKTGAFTIYYVPRMGGPSTPADSTCTLKERTTGKSTTVPNCYKSGEGVLDNWVQLWSGTGEEFQQYIGDKNGKQQPAAGYTFEMSTIAQGGNGDGSAKTYTAAIKVLKE